MDKEKNRPALYELSEHHHDIFDAVSKFHKLAKVELLRRWIVEAAWEIVRPMTEEKSEDIPHEIMIGRLMVLDHLDESDLRSMNLPEESGESG